MGGRKRHLGSFIWWTMINGLAFSWFVLPQCSLWASSDKRVFEGERTPQILLFVPDRAKPRPKCSDFNQVKPAKQGSAFMCKSQSLCVCAYVLCKWCACEKERQREGRDRRGKSRGGLKKSQHTTLNAGTSSHYSFKDIQNFAFRVR